MTKFQKRVILLIVTLIFIGFIVFLSDGIELYDKALRLNFAKIPAESIDQASIEVKI